MDYYDMDQSFDDLPDYDIYEPTSAEIWTSCTLPSIQQSFKYFLPFVFWNISFRIITQASEWTWAISLSKNKLELIHLFQFSVDIPLPYQHISSIICGLALSYITLGTDFLYSLTFTGIEYILLLIIRHTKIKQYGTMILVFCLVVLIMG